MAPSTFLLDFESKQVLCILQWREQQDRLFPFGSYHHLLLNREIAITNRDGLFSLKFSISIASSAQLSSHSSILTSSLQLGVISTPSQIIPI
tara:strand:- start:189 stop:464 length:276 start_codon:yes stop_codon:yes gene_type:complete